MSAVVGAVRTAKRRLTMAEFKLHSDTGGTDPMYNGTIEGRRMSDFPRITRRAA